MVRRFREAFLELLASTGDNLANIARGANVSVEQLKKLKQRDTASTNVDDAVKIAHHFGLSLDEFLEDDIVQVRSETLGQYAKLTLQERQFLQELAKARRAAAPRED